MTVAAQSVNTGALSRRMLPREVLVPCAVVSCAQVDRGLLAVLVGDEWWWFKVDGVDVRD